ncbi:TcfC E-set like domain-containing protein [Croceibacterium salegens]|nr:TcfC E-set like domain-containing protein [Croceibacterium salegens]
MLGCAVLGSLCYETGAAAQEPNHLVLQVGEPEGFDNLTDTQVMLVDVYFGGVRRGETQVRATPGTVNLIDAASAVSLLPGVKDSAVVTAALASGDLSTNAHLACRKSSDPAACGRLSPEVAGVIFDRERFRLDVFVNPRLLAVDEQIGHSYLPVPDGTLAVVNAFGGVISGETAGGTYYNLQDSLIAGFGDKRLRADLTYANDLGFGAERLALEWDRPDLRFSGGALWAPGSEIAGRAKLIGLGVESQIDTQLDRDQLLGSPLVVFLDRRARVDLIRDGRVMTSAIYEAGNQQVDTSGLPDGAYEIVLRIDEPGRPAREERRFFSKNRRVPSVGRTDFYAFGGLRIDDFGSGSLEPSQNPYFQGGISRRLSEHWAVGGSVEASDFGASGEFGATLVTSFALVHGAAIADLDGGYGGLLQIASAGSTRLNFNFDLRHIEANDSAAPLNGSFGSAFAGSYTQAGGIVSYNLAGLRLLGTFHYRDSAGQEASYSIGPAFEWDVLRTGPLTFTLRGDLTATERGEAGFAGISLRLLGKRGSVTALGGGRSSNMPDDTLGQGAVGALAAAWSPQLVGGELALGVGYDHQPEQDTTVLSGDFRHRLGSLAGDLSRTDGPDSAVTQYAVGVQTTLTAGGGTIEVAGRTSSESMVVAQVKGARPGDSFDVVVNEQVTGRIEGSRVFTLALPAYRAYDVRIRPTGVRLLSYDSSARKISLYPGTVARLEWVASPIVIKFGRLVDPRGAPLGHVTISGKGIWSETDEDGNFQFEAPDDAELRVTLRDGSTFDLPLALTAPRNGIARLGAVECCTRNEKMLGSLDTTRLPHNGEAR